MALSPPSRGSWRQRVQFQRRGPTTNVGGVPVGDWADLGRPRACSLLPTTGGEMIVGGRLEGRASHDLWLRFDSLTESVVAGDRAVDARNSARAFNIRFAVDPGGNRRWVFMQLELAA